MMLFAAGLGTRMQPLTNATPKALLQVKGRCLIDWHLINAAKAGIQEVVINVSHLHQQIIDHCGNGETYGLNIQYSIEKTPLETAGGLKQALHLLGSDKVLVVSADIFTDFDFKSLTQSSLETGVHLILVNNPEHNLTGDFVFTENLQIINKSTAYQLNTPKPLLEHKPLTYAGIAVIDTLLLKEMQISPPNVSNNLEANTQSNTDSFAPYSARLGDQLRYWVATNQACATYFKGEWHDIGTPQRLAAVNKAN